MRVLLEPLLTTLISWSLGLSLGVSLGVSLFSMLLVLVTKNSVLHAFGHDLLVRFRRVKSETIF